MKFNIPLLLLMIFSCVTRALAQPTDETPFRRFAVLAGVNVGNMNFNKGFIPPPVPVGASWKPGFTIGAHVHVPLANKLFLQPEYYYTQRRGADKSISTNYAIDYISLPVLLNYKILPFLSVVAGPQAELLIKAKQTKGGTETNITHDMEERSIAVMAGADLEIKKYFIVSARYMHGFNHVNISRPDYNREFKYEVVRLTAGVMF